MSGKRKRITSKIKAEIITALSKPDCVMSELGRKYGISVSTISQWRQDYEELLSVVGHKESNVNNFVEVRVKDEGDKRLEKALLVYNNFSLSIEGGIRSETLLGIIKLVEESC